jgi:hypothetical protein
MLYKVRKMSEGVAPGPADNPYAAPLSPSGEGSPVSAEESADWELRACVGRNADYYLRAWYGVLRGRRQSTGFNWAAFLLSGLWLPYRKMYVATLIFFVAVMAESFLEVVGEALIEVPPPAWLDRVVGLVFAGICGAFGNRWYLSHVSRVIAKARGEGLSDRKLRTRLASRGGTSVVAPIATILLFLATIFAIGIAVDVVIPDDDEDLEELVLPDDEVSIFWARPGFC